MGRFRNRMMATYEDRGIPYQRVEYLETDGEAYIDTGICPADISPVLEVEMYKKNQSAIYYVIGSDGSGNTRFSIGIIRSTSIEVRVGVYRQVTNKDERFYRIKLNSITGQCYIDDALVYTSGYKNAANNTYPILLFTSNASTGVVRAIAKGVRIARFRLWDKSGLVADYYPVVVDGIGYMYDKVTRRLIGNAGTGEFIIGGGKYLIISTLRLSAERRVA